jgi:hypothetical protein
MKIQAGNPTDADAPMSASTESCPTTWSSSRIALTALHWIIIGNFCFQICYSAYLALFVIVPDDGAIGPLFGRATQLPFELMVTRRLYATECWIAMAGLAIYLAITEIAPRMWQLPRRV